MDAPTPRSLGRCGRVIVDDLLAFSKEPTTIIEPKKKLSVWAKGCLYSRVLQWSRYDLCYGIQVLDDVCQDLCENVCDRISKLLEVVLKNHASPMNEGDDTETDLLFGNDISLYQMLIGCAQWAVTLGRFHVQYATNTLAQYASVPRKGHFDRCLRLFGYLQHNPKGRI